MELILEGYYVGSRKKWSKHFQFVSFPKHNNWSPSVAVFGDMGVENSRALNSLINGSVWGSFDAILHVGMSSVFKPDFKNIQKIIFSF